MSKSSITHCTILQVSNVNVATDRRSREGYGLWAIYYLSLRGESRNRVTHELHVWSSHIIAREWINPVRKPILLARGQLNRENEYFAVRLRNWFRERVQQSRPASACSSPYSGRIWCLLTGFLPSPAAASICLFKPPYAIGSVPSLSGRAIAYRWRSLPRVRRHRTSKPQGSSKRVLPWQVTMDQLINMRLSFPHPVLV